MAGLSLGVPRLLLVALLFSSGCDDSDLALHLDSARVEWVDDTPVVHVDARWENGTGGALEGGTCCSGAAFDGLSVVVRDASGGELARQSALAHQSPYARNVPYALARGTTRRPLSFMLQQLEHGAAVEVSLEGGLIGNADHAEGYASEALSVSVP